MKKGSRKIFLSSSVSSTAEHWDSLTNDTVVGENGCTYKAFHEATTIEVIGPTKAPKLFIWVNALKKHPLMKDTLPPHNKLMAKIKSKIIHSPEI